MWARRALTHQKPPVFGPRRAVAALAIGNLLGLNPPPSAATAAASAAGIALRPEPRAPAAFSPAGFALHYPQVAGTGFSGGDVTWAPAAHDVSRQA